EALVEIHAHGEVGEALAQARQRREAGRGLLDRAVRAVDRLERRALERPETLPRDVADDSVIVLGGTRRQRPVDRRVERETVDRRAVPEEAPDRHLLALGEEVVERLVQAGERGRG